jgi:hypothetical protein
LAADLISPNRPSNKIDIAYLYYLPFCMVFTSNDNLHAQTVPLFLRKDQVFIAGMKLKADFHKLDDHYSQLPDDVKETGICGSHKRLPLKANILLLPCGIGFCRDGVNAPRYKYRKRLKET